MNLKNKKIHRNKDVVFKKIDSRIIILDQSNSKLRELNETASLIWDLLEKPKTIEEIAKEIGKIFDASENDILTDIHDFVKVYYEDNLVDIV